MYGLPGTGKTTLALNLIKELAQEGKRVLVTGYSNQSVDIMLLKLKPIFDRFIRVAPSAEIVHKDLLAQVKCPSDFTTEKEIRTMLERFNVYACCASQVGFAELLMIQSFDVVIVDDSTLLNEPATLLPVI